MTTTAKTTAGNDRFKIAILDKWYVYVGECAIADGWLVISNAKNIRRWGTTKGLGQLALGGPTKDTILDDCGTVRVPHHAVISLIDCEVSQW